MDKHVPVSMVMLIHSRPRRYSALNGFLQADMYTRILAELLKSRLISRAELCIRCDRQGETTYQGITVHLVTDYSAINIKPADILFVRGDRKDSLAFLRSCPVRRMILYGASTRAIPRHWKKYHGILVDDISHKSIVHLYYPGTYVGEFIKTAQPEVFFPIESIEKQFDICTVTNMSSPKKSFSDLFEVMKRFPDLHFVVCGRVNPDIAEQLKSLPCMVTCTGFVERTELNRIFNRSRLALLPSGRFDASPRVILEFMAAGTPILANIELCGAKKFLVPGAGKMAQLSDFVMVIKDMLKQTEYDPRAVFEEYFTPSKAAQDFAGHIYAVNRMPDTPPVPSWRGRLAGITYPRVDKHTFNGN